MENVIGIFAIICGVALLLLGGIHLKSLLLSIGLILAGAYLLRKSGTIQRL